MRNPFEQPGLIVICTTIGLIGLVYLVKHVMPAASLARISAFTCRRRLTESWAHNRRPSGPTHRGSRPR
jgi:hypothetical protein